MVKLFIIVQDGQSLYDISVQLFGHQDGVASLLWDNPGVDLDALYPGQKLYYTPAVMDKVVLEYIQRKSYVPATASEMNDAPVPPPAPPVDMIIVTQADGSEDEVPIGENVTCSFPIIHLLNSENEVFDTIDGYPSEGNYLLADINYEVIVDGELYATFSQPVYVPNTITIEI